jgi:hypothetical protein
MGATRAVRCRGRSTGPGSPRCPLTNKHAFLLLSPVRRGEWCPRAFGSRKLNVTAAAERVERLEGRHQTALLRRVDRDILIAAGPAQRPYGVPEVIGGHGREYGAVTEQPLFGRVMEVWASSCVGDVFGLSTIMGWSDDRFNVQLVPKRGERCFRVLRQDVDSIATASRVRRGQHRRSVGKRDKVRR